MNNPIEVTVDINSENPNPIALEITKMLLSNNLSDLGKDVRTATAVFMGTYTKVLSEIKYFEKDKDAYLKVISTTLEAFNKN